MSTSSLRLIAYDIPDPKRLRRVQKIVQRFADRVQDSVYEAKRFGQAKLIGQRGLLLRAARNRKEDSLPLLHTTAAALVALEEKAEKTDTLPQLMGVEGTAARLYFAALPSALRRPLPLSGRSRRPPKDPVNALLSLGYGLLTAELIGGVCGVGLDPQIGFFHSARGRMPALSDGGVFLSKEALTVYFRHFRRRMTATYHDRSGTPTSLRRELLKQCAHIRRVYLGEEVFKPFVYQAGGKNREGESFS